MSSECDISRGLCCQLQRRHRQTPRKVISHNLLFYLCNLTLEESLSKKIYLKIEFIILLYDIISIKVHIIIKYFNCTNDNSISPFYVFPKSLCGHINL